MATGKPSDQALVPYSVFCSTRRESTLLFCYGKVTALNTPEPKPGPVEKAILRQANQIEAGLRTFNRLPSREALLTQLRFERPVRQR